MKLTLPKPNKKKILKTASFVGLGVLTISVGTVLVNSFFMDHYLEFQSPVVVRTPILVVERTETEYVSPIEVEAQIDATESAKQQEIIEEVVEEITELSGEASYYSENGCLGCSPTLTMANGERLDDSKLTMALVPEMFAKYKNMNLKVINQANNQEVIVKVTDSGGFAKYNRVADLSLATKQALGCNDICQVTISLPEEAK